MRHFRGAVVVCGAAIFVLLGMQNAGATSDPFWAKQYGPVQIGAPTAWQKSTGKNVKAAVVDTGVDVDHPDLKPNLDLADSHDFACNDDNPDDEPADGGGHGTHVSGTIAAVANNGIGVAGIAYDAKLMVERVSLSGGGCGGVTGTGLEEITQAVSYASSHGAKAINLSLGEGLHIPGLENTVTQACEQAFRNGSLCVVAAGNSGETKSSGYAYDFNAIVVTANDNTGAHASFGQKADTKWSVSAPGVDVLSTWPIDDPNHNGYNSIQGTSMAAPHVTGAATLLFATGMKNTDVAETLVKTAGPARDSTVEGAGIIHVDRALGFETTETSLGQKSGTGAGTVTHGGRANAGGGSAAVVSTTTTAPVTHSTGTVDFEQGITSDNSNSYEAALKQATQKNASRPFNAAGPLVGLTAVCAIASLAIFIPRLRAKDAPPLT
ncbi:MAG: serine protease [Actinomycetota bacterium]|jgi:subtilisin family serine protease